MRKFTLFALVLGLLAAQTAYAQVYGSTSYPLAVNWDVDGVVAADNAVVASANLADSTSYTIAASPDVCRLIDLTITDANSSTTAGIVTVTGTDCFGDPLVSTFDFSVVATRGSGVKTLTVGTPDFANRSNLASGAYYKTVSSVVTGVLTGEEGAGVDLLRAGYSTNVGYQYPAYGLVTYAPVPPWRYINLDGRRPFTTKVKNGTTLVDVTTYVAAAAPFTYVAVGDLIGFNLADATQPLQWRKVVTRTDANNIVVDVAITLNTLGSGFYIKKPYLSSDPQDGWFATAGFDALAYLWHETTTGANTGGLVSNVECAYRASGTKLPAIQVDTDTVASGSTGAATSSVDLRLAQYDWCRLGLKFGTNDDADATAANTEGVYMGIGQRR